MSASRPDAPKCPTTGKVCYSKDAAARAASAARRLTLGGKITKYRCDDWTKHPHGAGHYHIGHRPGSAGGGPKRKFKVRPL